MTWSQLQCSYAAVDYKEHGNWKYGNLVYSFVFFLQRMMMTMMTMNMDVCDGYAYYYRTKLNMDSFFDSSFALFCLFPYVDSYISFPNSEQILVNHELLVLLHDPFFFGYSFFFYDCWYGGSYASLNSLLCAILIPSRPGLSKISDRCAPSIAANEPSRIHWIKQNKLINVSCFADKLLAT